MLLLLLLLDLATGLLAAAGSAAGRERLLVAADIGSFCDAIK
jgi:hypothetical protein